MFDRRLVQYFDWGLLCLTWVLGTVGVLTLYSTVTTELPNPHSSLYLKQLIWIGGGSVIMFICFLFDYKLLDRWALLIYIGCVVMLVVVLSHGKYVGGSRRWLSLGPISLQPSEIVKLGVIIMLSQYYAKVTTTKGLTLRQLLLPIVLVLIPFVLIVKQPDLGTAMMILLIAGSMTLFVKIERRSLITLLVTGVVSIPMVWFFLKGYQKKRILTFLDPDRDPLGAGYHIIQSKIAIGSGMITGKGYMKGTQNALSFLPEQHTDFIFSVLSEEWGFLGSSLILCLFLLILIWGLNVAYRSRDSFGTLMASGISAMLFWQVFINIGMVMGLMPVVGVPLPLISYGGSSVLTTLICMGILLNISMRRFMFE